MRRRGLEPPSGGRGLQLVSARFARGGLSPEARASMGKASEAIGELARGARLALARKCGTGFRLVCTGYRHLEPGKSRIQAVFEFERAFFGTLAFGIAKIEYLDPATGQYGPVPDLQANDMSGGGPTTDITARACSDIRRLGRYRTTVPLVLYDVDEPTTIALEEQVVTEIDVLPSPPDVGGVCPPD